MTSIFSKLLSRFNGSVTIQEEHAYSGSSKLVELPLEVLQGIGSLLPLSSIASLSLCSHYTYKVLGAQYCHALRSAGELVERKKFLELLSRDLADWILCRDCLRFHQLIPTDGPKYLWRLKFTSSCTEDLGFAELAPDSIVKFQDIMKLRDRHDAYIGHKSQLQSPSHTYIRKLPQSTHEVSISARAVDKELLMRMEHRFFMPLGPDMDHINEHRLKICRHLQYSHDSKNGVARVIHCKLTHGDNQYCVDCSDVRHCKFCETEYLVEYRGIKSAIYVLVWRNFGSGEIACDPKWRVQAGVGDGEEVFQHAAACRSFQTPYRPGSIRSAFELHGDNKMKLPGHDKGRPTMSSSRKRG